MPQKTYYTPGMENLEDVTHIRYKKYGPGKFSDNIEEFLYECILNGWSQDTLGDEYFGTYDFLNFSGRPDRFSSVVVEEDGKKWDFSAAVITETEQGFVNAILFADLRRAEEEWKELKKEYEDFYEENEEREDNPIRERIESLRRRISRSPLVSVFLDRHSGGWVVQARGLYDEEKGHHEWITIAVCGSREEAEKLVADKMGWKKEELEENPSSTTVSIWFSKERFHSPAAAKRWIIDNGDKFSMANSYETDGFWAFPQMSEREESKHRGNIRSKYIADGVLIKFVPARMM